MSTANGSAHADARPLETKAGAPRTPADPIAAIAAEVTRQGQQIDALSTKRTVSVGDAKSQLHDRSMRTLKALRDTAAEAARRPDPLLNVKMVRQNADLDESEDLKRRLAAVEKKNAELNAALARPRGPNALSQKSAATAGRRTAALDLCFKATQNYLRTGSEIFQGQSLKDLQQKALTSDNDGGAGFTVTPAYDQGPIERLLSEATPWRQYATVQPISADSFKKPFNLGGIESGWVGERQGRPATATPTLAELNFPTMELYAQPAASQGLLDDSNINIEEWLADEVVIKFSEDESSAFVSGDGVNKPKGFIGGYDKVANDSYAWGKLGYIATGAAGAFPTSGYDKILDLTYSLKAGYRRNAMFALNRSTIAEVRKIKDTTGAYIWTPSGQEGTPAKIAGYEFIESEDMPDVAADAFSIAFGDFKRGYLIVDRVGIRVLRDPYSAKPYVLFYTTKRVGGGVQDFDAIKLLKFATT